MNHSIPRQQVTNYLASSPRDQLSDICQNFRYTHHPAFKNPESLSIVTSLEEGEVAIRVALVDEFAGAPGADAVGVGDGLEGSRSENQVL